MYLGYLDGGITAAIMLKELMQAMCKSPTNNQKVPNGTMASLHYGSFICLSQQRQDILLLLANFSLRRGWNTWALGFSQHADIVIAREEVGVEMPTLSLGKICTMQKSSICDY